MVINTISSITSIAVVAALLGFWFYSSFGRRKREQGRFSLAQSIKICNSFLISFNKIWVSRCYYYYYSKI